jgi:hypothetical protein
LREGKSLHLLEAWRWAVKSHLLVQWIWVEMSLRSRSRSFHHARVWETQQPSHVRAYIVLQLA